MRTKKIFLLLALLCAVVQGAWAQPGHVPLTPIEAPCDINNTSDWQEFCSFVNDGESYSGKTVHLLADITVSTMAGTSEGNSFKGTFDGCGHTLTFNCGNAGSAFNENYCAPFRYVNGATIKNLTVAGDIYTSRQFAAGLVAKSYGTTNIRNCRVGTVIYSSVDVDGTHGGIVVMPEGSLTIEGCAYTGRLLTNNGTNSCGGFVGWHNGATVSISNSLYAPSGNMAEGWSSINDGATFVRGGSPTITNCYYTEPMGDVQGYQVYTNASADGIYKRVTAAGSDTYYAVCNISGVDESYQKTGSAISVTPIVTCYGTTLTADEDYTCTFSPATVQEAGDYTLTITGTGSYSGTKTIQFRVEGSLLGEGTLESPYTISTADDWIYFCSDVNNGTNSYSGKFVKLTTDIEVSTMVGSSEENSFKGTFDGDGKTLTFNLGTAESAFNEEYCAPFRYVKDATIQNLKVAGDIYTSRKFAAGLVASPYGTTSITGCHVSTVIHSSVSDDGTHGGIAAIPRGTLTIEGCAYTGRLLTNSGTLYCGGFIGWHNNATISTSNSLYAPAGNIPEGWTAINDGGTFVRSDDNPTITNCYYTEPMGDAQGYLVYIDSPVNDIYKLVTAADGKTYYAVCNISGVDESYKKTGSAISVTPIVTCYGTTLTAGEDYTCTFSPATVQEAGDYTLTINGTGSYLGTKTYQFKVLAPPLSGNGTSDSPYIVSSTEDWNTFANAVNDGYAFTGNFVKLTADITVSTMVGASDGNSFQGIFDGDGKTLTFNLGTAESAFNEEYCAPFRYVKDATIQNLKVAGDIYTSRKFAAGLVASPYGTTSITGCHVSTVIHSSVSVDGTHGGIVAMPEGSLTIDGCAYTGRLLTNKGTNNCGGFVGWHNNATISVSNSLYAPDVNIPEGWSSINTKATFVRGGSPTITNCYYTETMGDAQGSQVYSALPDDEICKAVTISSVMGFTVYMMPVCTVSGVKDSYLLGEASITPAVTYNGNALTFGIDYTVKLDGESVASFPVSPDKIGINTLILTGTGDYAGTKTIEFTLLPSSTGDITFTDADTYTFMADVNVGSATYTKTLGEERVGKHQAWFVPFDYTITAADEEKFTFYKINMIANSPDPGQEANGDIWMFVKKMDAGDVLHANMPYVYKPKEAVTDYKFTTANAVLKAKANDARITMMTAEDTYTLYGTYEPTAATAADPFYYMSTNGLLSLGNNVTVGAFRWIMRVENKFGSSPSVAYAPRIIIYDGESETTSVNEELRMKNEESAGTAVWYTLDGRRLAGKPSRAGVYINNGIKVVIK